MRIARRFNATAVITHRSQRAERDAHGNHARTGTPSRPKGCYFEQTSSEEQASQTASTAIAMFEAGTVVDEGDAMTVSLSGDTVWTVLGKPRRPAPRGAEHHVHCVLQAVT